MRATEKNIRDGGVVVKILTGYTLQAEGKS